VIYPPVGIDPPVGGARGGGVYLVGVTGGIGSGKSTVAAQFAAHGWPVVDADGVAREIVASGQPALTDLAERFGAAVLTADGDLDRQALARAAFASAADRAALDAITHPRIAERIAERLAALEVEHAAAGGAGVPAIAVVDHPLLIETDQVDRFDALVVVLADADERVRRLVDHRGLEEADARARLRAQTDDSTRRAVATHLVVNDGGLEALAVATDVVIEQLEVAARTASTR
jgi:dephospho-CoA kinase